MIAHIRDDGTQQRLEEHLVNTANIAKKSGSKVGLSNFMYLTAFFHDLGKATGRFEEYLLKAFKDNESVRRGEVNHSSAGGKFLFERFFNKSNNDITKKLTVQLLTYAILAHHGLFDILTEDGDFIFDRRLNPKRDIFYHEVLENNEKLLSYLDSDIDSLFNFAVQEIDSVLQKIDAIVEEIGGQKQEVVENKFFLIGCLQRLILSILVDSDYRDTANFMEGIEFSQELSQALKLSHYELWDMFEAKVNQKVYEFNADSPINVVRRQLSDELLKFGEKPPGIYRMSIPTGGGKTLGGLRYALNHAKLFNKDRVIYVAPYLSILEQNANEYRKFLENDDLILEHHSNIVIDDEDKVKEYKLFTQTWDQPFILTTMVQFLNTLFSGKMQSIRRMHQLANSVIIIDEIQSLPIKLIHMFNLMMNFISKVCGATIILSSATQPLLDRVKRKIIYSIPVDMVKLKEYQLVPFKRTNIIPIYEKMDLNDLVTFILEKSKVEKSILVILNTKQAVRNVYDEIIERGVLSHDTLLIQLTTLMCPQHRSDTIEKLKKSLGKQKVICISTQLIEAGVDVSFSCVIRSLAGLDRIAQAAGRCNRNGENEEKGNVYVVEFSGENLDHLKEIVDEQKVSRKLLSIYKENPDALDGDLLSHKAMVAYYDNYFFEKIKEMDYSLSNKKPQYTLFELLSRNLTGFKQYNDINGQYPYTIYFQAFKTAGEKFEVIDSNTIGLIVPYGEGKQIINTILNSYDIKEIRQALQKAQRFTVNIYSRSSILDDLKQRRAIYAALNESIFILDEDYYKEEIGVSSEMPIHLIT